MTYHRTAIGRRGPSVPLRWLLKSGELAREESILDYGCGRGVDVDFLGCEGYDPSTDRPEHSKIPDKKFDVVLCTYVLNVIQCPSEREAVVNQVKSLLRPGGRAYFTVRRDIPKAGTPTQVFVELPELTLVRKTKSYEVRKT